MTALLAGLIAIVLIGPVRQLALQLNLTDRPGGHKTHAKVTPYLGGLVIIAAVVLSTGLSPVVVGAVAIGALGLVDDLRPISPRVRLAVETLIAAALVATGLRAPLTGHLWADACLTVACLVVVTNSMNLLDNSDAALGCVAVTLCGTLALAGGGPVMLAAGAATLAFLTQNWPPATIFMGDAGSLFLGFLLTGTAISLSTNLEPGAPTAAWLILVTFVALADTAVVVIARVRAGRSIFTGGSDHLAHRLRRLGLSRRATALSLGALASVSALAGWGVLTGRLEAGVTLAIIAVSALLLVSGALLVQPGQATVPAQGQSRDVLDPVGAGHPARR